MSPTTPRSTPLFAELGKGWEGLDGLVHSIAFAPNEAIEGDFLEGISRESFRIAHDISSYSYPALAKAARPLLLKGNNPSLLALSYLGAERTMPNYNTMGLAKASLEAATRYLAFCLGPQGIRANAVSAGPIKTLAASGIGNFGKLLAYNAHHAPLRRNVTIEEVGNTLPSPAFTWLLASSGTPLKIACAGSTTCILGAVRSLTVVELTHDQRKPLPVPRAR